MLAGIAAQCINNRVHQLCCPINSASNVCILHTGGRAQGLGFASMYLGYTVRVPAQLTLKS